jgi:hypothetical protein
MRLNFSHRFEDENKVFSLIQECKAGLFEIKTI